MPVEGIPQREDTITFTAQFHSYFPGEEAAFTADEAQWLVDHGVGELPEEPEVPPPLDEPAPEPPSSPGRRRART